MVPEARLAIASTILALGALANILLASCLAHTWKYWRQVKWYVIILVIGNLLDVVFNQGIYLRSYISGDDAWSYSTTSMCRFLMFMLTLGPGLSAMAVAALSLHVLLTSITGCQGTRLRHALVLGLFVLLSLALPLAKLPLFEMRFYDLYWREGGDKVKHGVCQLKAESSEAYLQLNVGESVAVTFFPLFVTLCCGVTSAVLMAGSGRSSEKGEADKSDLILTGLLGAALMVFCLPYRIFLLVAMAHPPVSAFEFTTLLNLQYLMDCISIVTAVITIVFAYAHAYRNRGGEFLVIPGGSDKTSGERQKLVN